MNGACVSALSGLDIDMPGGPVWILGECLRQRRTTCVASANRSRAGGVFLRRYYTVYNLGRDAVGFAEAV